MHATRLFELAIGPSFNVHVKADTDVADAKASKLQQAWLASTQSTVPKMLCGEEGTVVSLSLGIATTYLRQVTTRKHSQSRTYCKERKEKHTTHSELL